MGAKNTKNTKVKKNNKIMEESLEKKNIFKQNNLTKIPIPSFKKKEIFPHSDCYGFEIYKLKGINNAFYFVYIPKNEKNEIIIYKYYYEKEIFKEIVTIKFELNFSSEIIVKYFYNSLNKKKYIFIVTNYEIEIILIKKEKKFECITKETICYRYDFSELELFEIINNQYDHSIYIIISYYLRDNYISNITWRRNYIKILTFKNDKLILIKEFEFQIYEKWNQLNNNIYNLINRMNMIYEDKYSKKYYILMVRDNNLQFIEIKHKDENDYEIKNFFKSENDLKQFTEIINKKVLFKGCVINKSNDNYNNDYLYLFSKEGYFSSKGNIAIIDLSNRKIIENIKININKDEHIISLLNWNNKNLILQFENSFYIFDTRINKIISKYSCKSGSTIYYKSYLKTFFSIENNIYWLFTANLKLNFYIPN